MKKLKQTSSVMMVGILALMINGCKKDDNSNYVTKGANNNTVNSSTCTINNWVADNNNFWYYYNYTDVNINSSVLSGGSVQVFFYNSYDNNWFALPFSRQGAELTYSIELSHLVIYLTNSDMSMPANPGSGWQFRVVVIPPSAMVTHPNADFRNYMKVKTTFNIPD